MQRFVLSMAVLGVLAATLTARAQEGPSEKEVQAVVEKAVAFLKTAQKDDGSFAPKLGGPGVSCIVAAALLRNGVSADDPLLANTLKYMQKNVKEDGGVYDKFLANYTTSVAIVAFKEANKDGKYDALLKNAAAFIRKIQFDEPETSTSNVNFGGFSYDGKGRADLSNSNFSVEALIAAGVPKDDPAIKKALKFITRSQNLAGDEANDQPFAKKATKDDVGGFTYVPSTGKGKGGKPGQYETPDGGLRSLGGMTYGGLKSFLYAGVSKEDPRVKAAVAWCRAHYTLDENPGMKQAGLYYYYHTFAKAMDAYGENPFVDAKGTKHQWRAELFQALKSRQRDDGAWSNKGDTTFGEASPELATAFALLSLSYTKK